MNTERQETTRDVLEYAQNISEKNGWHLNQGLVKALTEMAEQEEKENTITV